MYLAGVSVRRVEDITEALAGVAIDGVRPQQEDLRDDRDVAQPMPFSDLALWPSGRA
jgi:hypothetical protein